MTKKICKKCEYEWDWKGQAKFWICCPRCRANIKVTKIGKVKNEHKQTTNN